MISPEDHIDALRLIRIGKNHKELNIVYEGSIYEDRVQRNHSVGCQIIT